MNADEGRPEAFEHRVFFNRGHDCRRFECLHGNPKCKVGGAADHGSHGLRIRFVAIGPKGAVLFLLFTDWLPQFRKAEEGWPREVEVSSRLGPTAATLAVHSPVPLYEGQELLCSEPCPYLDGLPCYGDSYYGEAENAFYALLNGGDRGIWAFLEGYYEHTFHGAACPAPCEYPKPLRNPKAEEEVR